MSDQLLNALKVALLGLLYLFFARVLWAVWTEVRVPTAAGLAVQRLGRGKGSRAHNASAPNVPSKLLLVEPAEMRGSTLSLVDEVRVGRSPECDVALANDPFVSTHHARFFRSGENWIVEDEGSTNGTLVNSQRITTPTAVRIDDRVQIGSAVFEVH
jgi:hypothetical protein